MTFGKNRVQYNPFYWKFYRFDRFDVYSYEEGTELSLYVADYVEKEIEKAVNKLIEMELENLKLLQGKKGKKKKCGKPDDPCWPVWRIFYKPWEFL